MLRKLREIFHAATDLHRAALELGAHHAAWFSVRDRVPRGDGHPVLILPGMGNNDGYMAVLHRRVAEKGYRPYGWDAGVNMGLDNGGAARLRARLESISAENRGAKVSIVGYSLGGIYARELARECPELVRGVITIGTPFDFSSGAETEVLKVAHGIYGFLNPETGRVLRGGEHARRLLTPPPVPTTSVFSRRDGFAGWRASVNPSAPLAENVEVVSSHTGFPWNLAAVVVVLDRLAQAPGTWRPFRPGDYRGLKFSAPRRLPLNPAWQGQGGGFFG